ncbi:hypothetical protein C8J57DRAFT_1250088 [Mycena rebaudengoi]|nr:hypothetical protein C8J57DRAFT_1250088 [Mycena rebaudengoi]
MELEKAPQKSATIANIQSSLKEAIKHMDCKIIEQRLAQFLLRSARAGVCGVPKFRRHRVPQKKEEDKLVPRSRPPRTRTYSLKPGMPVPQRAQRRGIRPPFTRTIRPPEDPRLQKYASGSRTHKRQPRQNSQVTRKMREVTLRRPDETHENNYGLPLPMVRHISQRLRHLLEAFTDYYCAGSKSTILPLLGVFIPAHGD